MAAVDKRITYYLHTFAVYNSDSHSAEPSQYIIEYFYAGKKPAVRPTNSSSNHDSGVEHRDQAETLLPLTQNVSTIFYKTKKILFGLVKLGFMVYQIL